MDPNEARFTRAAMLFQRQRWEQAEAELRRPGEPLSGNELALLALVLLEQSKFDAAQSAAADAIATEPTLAAAHRAMATVLLHRGRLAEAESAAFSAVEMDPYDVMSFAMLATIQLGREQPARALASADAGLQLDADDERCRNIRSLALVRLGRRDEAAASAAGTLQDNPESALSHTTAGYAALHANDPATARTHFREALRLDPTSDWARAGMVEAIKAKNLAYRLMLMYFLWMERIGGRAQWAVIIGIFVIGRVLQSQAQGNLPLTMLRYGLMAFVLLTWIAMPLGNLLLRLHPDGRHALSQDQRRGSNLLAAVLLAALLSGVAGYIAYVEWLFILGIALAVLLIPAAAVYSAPSGWPRKLSAWVFAVLLGAIALGTSLLAAGNDTGLDILLPTIIASGLSALVLNILIRTQVRQ